VIRERRAEDDAAIAQIIREVAPSWVTSEDGVRHRRVTAPARARRGDWIAELDREVVGWGSGGLATEIERDDVAWLNVMVRPAWRGRGVGAALSEPAVSHVLGLGARRLLTEIADEPVARRFAEQRGFHHTMTRRLSSLDPRTVDEADGEALAAEKELDGFTVAPFAAFRDRPELVYAVDVEASLDEPADEPFKGLPLDDWVARYWRNPDLSFEGSFTVVAEGRPVAITEVLVDLDGRRAGNGFTGTLRAYRGRGLARLAKLASIAWLRRQGVTLLVTQNDATNAAMLAVNTRLGFRPFATWLSYVRDVE
jgi:GNAT superfamily N-acetyltransferase